MKKLSNFMMIGLFVMCTSACNLDYFEQAEIGDIIFDPSIALPVGEITYTTSGLFESLNDAGATVGTTDEDVISLVYEEELQSQSASSLLSVQDQTFGSSLQGGTTVTNPISEQRITVSDSFEFDFSQNGGEDIDSIYFSAGSLGVDINSGFDVTINYTLTFNSLVSNGAPLVVSGSLAPNSTDSSQESLSGYVGNFTLGATNDKFLVNVEYVVIVPTGSSITATDELDFSLSIRNTTFNTVFGDIGSQDLSVDVDATSLDFFNEFQTGSITFADPSIELIFENSFGFPVGVSFPEFAGITSDGTTIRLTGSINDNVNIITGPTVNERGQILTTNLPINRENSNISELLSAQPEELRISVNAVTNPAGTNQYNFIDETALLDVTTRIEIPFELNINNLGAEQSLDFSGGADLQDASRLLFRLISENELPMGGEVELIFRDANDNTLVQVDPVTAFSAAPVGADGRTNDVATSTADIVLEEDDIRAIENATSIGLVVTLSTTDAQSNQAVKFFEDYELKVKLAVQADVSLNANGN